MLFADFTHPCTIAAVLIEAVLLSLAFAAASRGIFIRSGRRLARDLSAVSVALGLWYVAGMLWELLTSSLPVVLADGPLGTYPRITQLGLRGSIALFGLLLVLLGCLGLLEQARKGLQHPRLPEASLIVGVVGALVLASWWRVHARLLHPPVVALRRLAHQRLQAGTFGSC